MNKKDVVIINALMNVLMDNGIDINKYIPEERKEKFIEIMEKRFSELTLDEGMIKEWIIMLEKYVKRIC